MTTHIAAIDTPVRFTHFGQALQQRLAQPLPGTAAQYRMATASRRTEEQLFRSQQANPRLSAVLALLYLKADSLHTALMQRTADGYAHSGQISFPGGRSETSDTDLRHTALREAYEEFGIEPHTVQTVGSLTPLYIPVSNSLVTPYVGLLHRAPTFIPNPAEVAHIIEVPIAHLLQPDTIKQTTLTVANQWKIHTPYYDVQGQIVWGATAMIISELLQLLSEAVAAPV